MALTATGMRLQLLPPSGGYLAAKEAKTYINWMETKSDPTILAKQAAVLRDFANEVATLLEDDCGLHLEVQPEGTYLKHGSRILLKVRPDMSFAISAEQETKKEEA